MTATISLEPATQDDAAALAELRVAAMRPSLERIGRFDEQRARQRFLGAFDARSTRHIVKIGQRTGFVVIRQQADHLLLDHLYIHPDHQGGGIGAAVLALLFAEADLARLPLRVGALRDSDSNRFYLRHGFELVERAEWDNYYVRRPARLD
jgi:GNAT superfamily N-acetyltransferase